MIKIKLRLYNLSFINYAGCQDGCVPNGIKEQPDKVDENRKYSVENLVKEIVPKIISQVLQNQTEARTGNTLQTVLHKIIYHVYDREVKNHTLTSVRSLYRPYKGVPLGIIHELGDI